MILKNNKGEHHTWVLLFVVSLCYILCRFLKKAPQKLSLIALCEMYKAHGGFGSAMYVR